MLPLHPTRWPACPSIGDRRRSLSVGFRRRDPQIVRLGSWHSSAPRAGKRPGLLSPLVGPRAVPESEARRASFSRRCLIVVRRRRPRTAVWSCAVCLSTRRFEPGRPPGGAAYRLTAETSRSEPPRRAARAQMRYETQGARPARCRAGFSAIRPSRRTRAEDVLEEPPTERWSCSSTGAPRRPAPDYPVALPAHRLRSHRRTMTWRAVLER